MMESARAQTCCRHKHHRLTHACSCRQRFGPEWFGPLTLACSASAPYSVINSGVVSKGDTVSIGVCDLRACRMSRATSSMYATSSGEQPLGRRFVWEEDADMVGSGTPRSGHAHRPRSRSVGRTANTLSPLLIPHPQAGESPGLPNLSNGMIIGLMSQYWMSMFQALQCIPV